MTKSVPFHNKTFWDGVWSLPGSWVADAACAAAGFPDAWFPDGEDRNAVFAAARAKAICRACPVRAQCLDYAMSNEASQYRYGIFGGLSPGERRKLWKDARAAAR